MGLALAALATGAMWPNGARVPYHAHWFEGTINAANPFERVFYIFHHVRQRGIFSPTVPLRRARIQPRLLTWCLRLVGMDLTRKRVRPMLLVSAGVGATHLLFIFYFFMISSN